MGVSILKLQQLKDSARGFRELMALYEQNYIRFCHLVDDIGSLESPVISARQQDIDLHMQVLERCRYTTTVLLTYRLVAGSGPQVTPNLKIRLYHDARQAEVLACCNDDSESLAWMHRDACGSTIQWRWRMNYFLYRWLGYCLKMGHFFPQQRRGISWDGLFESLEQHQV